MNMLLPLWRQALEKSGFSAHYVIMVRRPDEVARSLKLRDNIDRQKSLLLWATYMTNCERLTRLNSRIFVHFDALFDDHSAVTADMERTFGFAFPRRTRTADAEATVDPRSRHHNMAGPLRLSEGLKPIGVLYAYLSALAAGAAPNDEAPNNVRAWLRSLDSAVGPLLAAAERELSASRAREAASARALNETTLRLNALQEHAADLQSALAVTRAEAESLELEKAELYATLAATGRRRDEAVRTAKDEMDTLRSSLACRAGRIRGSGPAPKPGGGAGSDAQDGIAARAAVPHRYRTACGRGAKASSGRGGQFAVGGGRLERAARGRRGRANERGPSFSGARRGRWVTDGRDAVSAEAARLRAALKRIEGSFVWRMFGGFAGPAAKR